MQRLGSTEQPFADRLPGRSARGPAVPRVEQTARRAYLIRPQIRLKAMPFFLKLALPTTAAKVAGSLTPPAEMRQLVSSVGAALHSRQLA